MSHKVFFAKNLITNFTEVCHFIVINRNENHTIIPQQVGCQPQTGIHHIQPVGVIPAHRLRVGLGCLLGDLLVPGQRISKIICVNKIIAGVIRRVDVDHLDLAVVGRLQQLQHLQVISLDVEVLGGVPVDAFSRAGTQGPAGTLLGKAQALGFALPLKAVLFKVVVNVFAAQRKQLVDIQLAFADALRENRAQLVQVGLLQVHGKAVHFIHLNTHRLSF